jgi:FG-GAP repeat/WD40-like Beta Propeller Repeat
MKHIVRFYILVLLFAGCSGREVIQSNPVDTAIFGDSDIDGATLDVATQNEEITAQDLGELPAGTDIEPLPESEGDFTAQSILPGASGFVYYIRYQAGLTNPWSVQRANQTTDILTTIYSGQREIQSVGGSLDGNLIVLSMRQTTATTSDFEIYRLNASTQTVQQLTNDTIDNTNVSSSANSLVIAWQQPVNSIAKVVLRTYGGTTATTFTERVLSFTTDIRQPSLSSNGSYLTFVRDRVDGFDQVFRYDVVANTYLALFSAAATNVSFEHPSISNDGNKVLWLQNVSGSLAIRLRNISAGTSQTVVTSSKALEHPSITADGNFAAYGYSATVPASVITVYTINLTTAQKTVVRSMLPSPSILQLGMVWQKNFATPPQANEQPVTPNPQDTGFGWSPSISGNTAVIGGRNGTYVLERNTQSVWQITKSIQIPIETPPNTQIFFPNSSAISGNTIVIGTWNALYDIDGDGIKEKDVGAAFVYERNQGGINNWGLVKELISSDKNVKVLNSGGIRFGVRVAIEGDTVVVSAAETPITGTSGTTYGAVYVFSRNQGGTNNWGQVKRLTPTIPLSFFGTSLSLSNGTLIVGSYPNPLEDNFTGWAAHIFTRDQGGINNWGEVKRLTTNISREAFGYDVSISGDTAVVAGNSDYDANRNGTIECGRQTPNVGNRECDLGAVYIFFRNQGGTNNWGLLKKLTPLNFKGFEGTPITVAISNGRLVLGSPNDESLSETDGNFIGAAYVFEQNLGGTNNWGQTAKLLPSDLQRGASFAWQIAFQSSTLLVSSSPYTNTISFFYELE